MPVTYSRSYHATLFAPAGLHTTIGTYLKNMSIPEYLAAVGKLEDGLRVADKMLDDHTAPVGQRTEAHAP